jgi:hypothetical protein
MHGRDDSARLHDMGMPDVHVPGVGMHKNLTSAVIISQRFSPFVTYKLSHRNFFFKKLASE